MIDNFYEISVIIPVHNNLPLFENTLRSVMMQSFKNFEIIIVDDGSTDNSSKVALEILKNSNIDFQLFNQVNSGVSVARNKGLMNARGKFIYFIDGDDWIENNCFEELHKCIIETKSDLAVCGYDSRTPEGKILRSFEEKFVYPAHSLKGDEYGVLMLTGKTSAPTGGILWDKTFLSKTKIKYTPGAFSGEDLEFTFKNLSKAIKVSVVKKTLMHYVIYDKGHHNKNVFRGFNGLGCILRVEKYLIKTSPNSQLLSFITSRTIPLSYLGAFNYLIRSGFPVYKISNFVKYPYIREKMSLISLKKAGIERYIGVKIAVKLLMFSPKLYAKIYFLLLAHNVHEWGKKSI